MKLFRDRRQDRLQQQLAQLRPRLYRSALAWCGNPELADDLVQEALSKALQKMTTLKETSSLDAWIFSILVNCRRDHYRRCRPEESYREQADERQPTADQALQTEQTVERVRASVQRLSEGQREVLALVDLEGFSYAEVSGILQIPIGTVMSRLNRARSALRQQLLAANDAARGTRRGHLERVK
ncbi:MAG TPA: sigma-70 family RNA polymerase sigma factor [Sedimenticola thiotaurini]|uniref:Sigma-70 family RNA polymerase sigma factor n=1 Tax=Sedimenticola thiotaurini TaxID=1543721 RepID=A0A831RJS8_9GAMM|nr:sigma-70 family RNA polymerase sigma factor [Sedimenticola thiotaurini]